MAIITKTQAEGIPAFTFGASISPSAEAQPFAPQQIGTAPASKPTPAADAAPTAPVAEQPIVEVPAELLEQVCGLFYQEVVQHAEQQVMQSATAELEVLQSRYGAAVQKLVGVSNELAGHNQTQLMELACAIGMQLARGALRTDPMLLFGLVREALDGMSADEVVIHCAPMDADYLIGRVPELERGGGRSFKVRVIGDPSLEPGDFRTESRLGSIDGRMAVRLEEVRRAMESS